MSINLVSYKCVNELDNKTDSLGAIDYTKEVFKTGEVIRARVKNSIIVHYGIIVVENGVVYVLHNPMKGPISKDTLDIFFKNRVLQKHYVKQTNLDNTQLLGKFNAVKNKEFNIATFNCEDFVNYMIGRNEFGYAKIFLFTSIFFFALYLFNMNKSNSVL